MRKWGLVKERRNVNLRHVSAIAFESFQEKFDKIIVKILRLFWVPEDTEFCKDWVLKSFSKITRNLNFISFDAQSDVNEVIQTCAWSGVCRVACLLTRRHAVCFSIKPGVEKAFYRTSNATAYFENRRVVWWKQQQLQNVRGKHCGWDKQ